MEERPTQANQPTCVPNLCPLWDELSVVELRSLLRSYPIDRTSLPAAIERLRRNELIEALNQIQALGSAQGATGPLAIQMPATHIPHTPMTATLTTTNPAALGEPTPGSPEALLLLANAGVLPASSGTDDPRFSADAITTCVSRLLEVKQQQELLASEQKGAERTAAAGSPAR